MCFKILKGLYLTSHIISNLDCARPTQMALFECFKCITLFTTLPLPKTKLHECPTYWKRRYWLFLAFMSVQLCLWNCTDKTTNKQISTKPVILATLPNCRTNVDDSALLTYVWYYWLEKDLALTDHIARCVIILSSNEFQGAVILDCYSTRLKGIT